MINNELHVVEMLCVTAVTFPQVSLLIPGCDVLPPELSDYLNNLNSFYLLKQLPVYRLLDPQFLQSAVYNGEINHRYQRPRCRVRLWKVSADGRAKYYPDP